MNASLRKIFGERFSQIAQDEFEDFEAVRELAADMKQAVINQQVTMKIADWDFYNLVDSITHEVEFGDWAQAEIDDILDGISEVMQVS